MNTFKKKIMSPPHAYEVLVRRPSQAPCGAAQWESRRSRGGSC